MLKTETNTHTMERKIRSAAYAEFRRRDIQANFEHGQWWITLTLSGAQYSVCDANTPSGFCFEQVTVGEREL